jgi:leucyl aminopeptidase
MQYLVKHTDPASQTSDCFIVGIFIDQPLPDAAAAIDRQSGGYLTALLKRGDLANDCGQTLLLHDIPKLQAARALLVNCGKALDFNERAFRKVCARAIQTLQQTGVRNAVSYLADLPVKGRDAPWKIRQGLTSAAEASYLFDRFKSQKKTPAAKLQKLIINLAAGVDLPLAQRAAAEARAISAGIQLTKDLGNTPANICTPSHLAEQSKALTRRYPAIKTQVLEEKALAKLGMNALLSVTKGSHQPAKFIVLRYQMAAKSKKPVVLVGKGVTFDSGGLSLKTPAGMEEMKFDMCGAASVLGVFTAIAELALPINLIGVIPAVENLPGGSASKPGDIVATLSGQTIEILNTDAEGRLILADALTYCERFQPDVVIDIATLTGAITIALGAVASGLFGNHAPLITALQSAADSSGDAVWPLPLGEEYQEQIASVAADMANVGQGGGKSITAACLLARFAKNFHWAHLDVAGTAVKDKLATGRPVSLLLHYLLERHRDEPAKKS